MAMQRVPPHSDSPQGDNRYDYLRVESKTVISIPSLFNYTESYTLIQKGIDLKKYMLYYEWPANNFNTITFQLHRILCIDSEGNRFFKNACRIMSGW